MGGKNGLVTSSRQELSLGSHQGKSLDCSLSHDAFIVPDCNQVLRLGPGLSSILSSTKHLSPGCSNCRSSKRVVLTLLLSSRCSLSLPRTALLSDSSLRCLRCIPTASAGALCAGPRSLSRLEMEFSHSFRSHSWVFSSEAAARPRRPAWQQARNHTALHNALPWRGCSPQGHLTPLLSRQPCRKSGRGRARGSAAQRMTEDSQHALRLRKTNFRNVGRFQPALPSSLLQDSGSLLSDLTGQTTAKQNRLTSKGMVYA